MTHRCFTYGTLMCEEVMRHVCGRTFAAEPARLYGYSRHPVAGAPYPGIRPNPRGQVEGILYRHVAPRSLTRLDAFEGPQYERRRVEVVCADGRRVSAQAYVFKPSLHHLLLPGDWDFQRFLAHGRRHSRYFGS